MRDEGATRRRGPMGDRVKAGGAGGRRGDGGPGAAVAGVRFVLVDYSDRTHARDLVALLDGYARDPMGGGEPLSEHARSHLVATLAVTPNAFSMLGYVTDEPAGEPLTGGRAVALANCFTSLSTFACRPLVNVHDLAVAATHRGQGIGRALLEALECEARARGACKITLEVLEGNGVARRAYERVGFRPYTLDEATGTALFLEKRL